MRTLSLGVTVLSLLAFSAVGCAEESGYSLHRHNVPMQDGAGEATGEAAAASTVTVNGQTADANAKTVDVLALGEKGDLTPVAGKVDVKDGKFQTTVTADDSPTGIFILKVKDLAGSVVGSATVNGLPAFIKAFAVDATVDATTSFKTQILTTIAKKGVPGVQNYLNVIDAYVDAQLANVIVTTGAIITDVNAIVGATSDAIIAAENVIVDTLKKAGIPVDITALQQAQLAAVSGFQGLVTSANGKFVTTSKNLITALEAATAKAAAPVDEAIFNAVVNGGAAFGASMKKSNTANPAIGFAASKSAFSLETALSTSAITSAFQQNGGSTAIMDALTKACAQFASAVGGAANLGDLDAAKAAFTEALLGKQGTAAPTGILALITNAVGQLTSVLTNLNNTLAPLANELQTAFATLDNGQIGEALAKFDLSTTDLPAQLRGAVSAKDATAIADALRLVHKQVAQ